MANSFIQPPANTGLGLKIDTSELTVGINLVERQNICIADPTTAANVASVTATGAVKVDASATTQPVSGTFFQGTQPVSLATLPALVAGSATIGNVNQTAGTAGFTKILDTAGTNVAAVTAANAVKVDGSAVTQPVSGTVAVTNFANPLPVSQSGTWTVQPGNTPNTTAWKVDGSAVTQPVSVAAAVTVAQATAANLNATVAGTVTANTGTLPTLTKGTQGATGFSVQELHDAGRNTRVFMLDTITAAPVAETLASVVQWYGNAAVAATTTPAVVPAGKTLRLTNWKIQYQSLATVGYAVVRVRINTAGVVALASPLAWSFEAGTNSGATTTAVTGAVTTACGDFPEGFEIPAAAGVGFSVAGYGPTGTLTLEGGVRFAVFGYEY